MEPKHILYLGWLLIIGAMLWVHNLQAASFATSALIYLAGWTKEQVKNRSPFKK